MTSIVEEPMSEVLGKLLREDGEIVVWWGTLVECAVAISRLLREGMLTEEDEEEARASLELLAEEGFDVLPNSSREPGEGEAE